MGVVRRAPKRKILGVLEKWGVIAMKESRTG